MAKDPYRVIKHQHATEKAQRLRELQESTSNRSVARCKLPKYVFIVDSSASKRDIADAIEEMHKDKQVQVVSVNTINVKPKPRQRGKYRAGTTPAFKKAIVTLEEKDRLENT